MLTKPIRVVLSSKITFGETAPEGKESILSSRAFNDCLEFRRDSFKLSK